MNNGSLQSNDVGSVAADTLSASISRRAQTARDDSSTTTDDFEALSHSAAPESKPKRRRVLVAETSKIPQHLPFLR